MNTDNYCVVYRTGGTDNFKWHRSSEMSKEVAIKTREELLRGGRPAYAVIYDQSNLLGLPETYQ